MLSVLKSTLIMFVVSVLLVSCGGSDDPTPDTNPPIASASPASTGVNEAKALFSVELSCADTGGSGCNTIYYTTNGDVPTLTSTEYTAAIDIPNTQTTILKFIAEDIAGNKSGVVTETYTYDVTAPSITASVNGGTYSTIQQVDLTCTDETNGSGCDAIHYTLDGSVPSKTSQRYDSTLILDSSLTLRFIAYDAASNASTVGEEIYQFDFPSITSTNFPNGSKIGVKHIFTVDFSKIIDPATVSSTSFVVAKAGTTNSIVGAYDIVDKQLSFTPEIILDNASTYSIILKVTIADLSGSTLQTEYNASVTTPVQPTVISGQTYGESGKPSVYRFATGNIMIWLESDGRSASSMYRYKLDSQATWSDMKLIPQLQSPYGIKVSSNGDEIMLVEKAGPTGLQYMIFSGTSWGSMQPISVPTSVTFVRDIFLAPNNAQFSLVVHTYNSTPFDSFYYKNYSNNQWSTVEQKLDVQNVSQPRMVPGNNGLLMTWLANSSQLHAVYNTFGAWGVDQQLPSVGSTNRILYYKSAPSSAGFALAWVEETTADTNIANLFMSTIELNLPTPVWATAIQVTSIAVQKYSLAFDVASSDTKVVLVWSEDSPVAPNTNSQHRVYSREFTDTASGWSVANPLSVAYSQAYPATSLQAISNGTGYAVIWKDSVTDGVGVSSANFKGVIHDGISWQSTATLGTGSNVVVGFNKARAYLISNGQTYAVWWSDYINSNSTGAGLKFTATVSLSDNTWPTSPEVLLDRANVNFDDVLITTDSGYNGLWYANDGKGMAFFNKEYTNAAWDAAESLYFAPLKEGASIDPKIAMNSSGVQVAVWAQFDLHVWRFYASSNTGAGWMPAINISDCAFDNNSTDIKLDILSNGTDFMIFCEGLFPGGFGFQSYVTAISFDGTTFSASTRIGQLIGHSVATNGNNYAIAYPGPGLTKSNGQYIREYDVAAKQWLDAVLVYDTDSTITAPFLKSNGTDYALAWHESISINAQIEYQLTAVIYDNSNQVWNSTIITPIIGRQLVTPVLTGYNNDSYAVSWVNSGSFTRIYDVVGGKWSEAVPNVSTNIGINIAYAMSENNGDLGLVLGNNISIKANTYTAGVWQQEILLAADTISRTTPPSIAANNSGYAVTWSVINNDGTANILTSRFRNGKWSSGYSINNGDAEYNSQPQILDVGTGFQALWSQRDPTHPTDKTSARIVISEEY